MRRVEVIEDGERAAAGVLAERVPGRVGAREVGGAQDHAPAHQEGEENLLLLICTLLRI